MYNPNNTQGQFSGTWNPDTQNNQNGQRPPQGSPSGKGPAPGQGPAPMPNIIDGEWSAYIVSGLIAYSIYRKYFRKEDFDGDGIKEGCPVNNDPLDFNINKP